MIEMLIISAGIGLIVAVAASVIALTAQRHQIDMTQAQLQAWEHAQEIRQQRWNTRFEKRATILEQELSAQVQGLEAAWKEWEAKDDQRAETLEEQYNEVARRIRREQELATILRVDEVPLALQSLNTDNTDNHTPHHTEATITYWQPLRMPGVDLSHRDFSHRYLRHADLRGASLAQVNFYMADLSQACLAGADLTNANLAAANLTGTDLTGAKLVGANFLVADLYNTMLSEANLVQAHNLTVDQLSTASVDNTTLLDSELAITLPRIARMRNT